MATWSFSGFDWTRFRALAPELKRAAEAADWRILRDGEAADVIASLDPAMDAAVVCNCVIAELCSTGASVVFRGGLPEFLRNLSVSAAGEEAADLLSEAAFASANIEQWFAAELGLIGILSWASLDHLRSHLDAHCRERPRPKRQRGIAGLVGRLKPGDSEEERLTDLVELVDECVAGRLGLAVMLSEP